MEGGRVVEEWERQELEELKRRHAELQAKYQTLQDLHLDCLQRVTDFLRELTGAPKQEEPCETPG